MKIKLSKNQWEEMGKKAGWMKTATTPESKNHKIFPSKKEALEFLEDHALMCVGWMENGKEKSAIYWNGKRHIQDADAKW